jgi:hypothetical protein
MDGAARAGAWVERASQTSVDPVAAAHQHLLQDRSIQFAFDSIPEPPTPPSWLVALLRAIAKALRDAGPIVPIALWSLLALGVGLVLFVIVREVVIAPRRARERPADLKLSDAWRPTPQRAKALLEEADRLAAQGLYAEAAHVLLFRSIEDVEGRRPDLIAPSLTSRDIAGLPELPRAPREAFAHIAAVVEAAIFGGRPVDAERWAGCREAYTRFAFADGWAVAA